MPMRRRGGATTTVSGRRALKRYGYKSMRASMPIHPRRIATNTAAVRENYSISVPDGTVTFFSFALGNAIFNRSISVAESFQEYRVKYAKLTFRPSADTYAPGTGPIPQLYFQYNKTNAILTSANLQTLLDMGCRPIRFDDKNIVKAWKPTVLVGADQTPSSSLEASSVRTTPWCSTNLFAQNPGSAWSASLTEHLGAAFLVTRPNPAGPASNYFVDVEVVFQFRKPLSLQATTGAYSYTKVTGGEVNVVDVSGAVVPV